jgi:DNA-binding transcriptional MerR regulator
MTRTYDPQEPITEQSPISAQLRSAGKSLAAIGKAIEDSQVEDGDPPFTVSNEDYEAMKYIASMLHRVQKSLTTAYRENCEDGPNPLAESKP